MTQSMTEKLTGWMEFNGGLIARFPNPNKNEPVFNYYENVAGFNLDNTLLKPTYKLIENEYDFGLIFQNCILRLADIHRQDYSIVVISDQTLITKGIISIEILQRRFDCLVKMLSDKNIPVIGIFTTKYNCYKKPHTWTWKFLTELYRGNKRSINLKESYYVGNLAGRVAKHPLKKDSDYTDRAYAHNIGIEFKVPEQIFRQSAENREYLYENTMNDKEKEEFIESEMLKYKESPLYRFKNLYEYCLDQSNKLCINDSTIASQKASFIIIMIGPPCSGKTKLSTLIASHAVQPKTETKTKAPTKSQAVIIPEYYYEDNQQKQSFLDENKKRISSAKRERIIDNFIQDGRILIIDGNYATHDSRIFYLQKAAEYKMPVIFIKLNPPYKVCRQFNHIKLEKSQDKFRQPLSDGQFKKYNKSYQKPDLASYMIKYPGMKCTMIEVPTIIITSVKEFRNIY